MLAQQERVTQRKGVNDRIFTKYQVKQEKKEKKKLGYTAQGLLYAIFIPGTVKARF